MLVYNYGKKKRFLKKTALFRKLNGRGNRERKETHRFVLTEILALP